MSDKLYNIGINKKHLENISYDDFVKLITDKNNIKIADNFLDNFKILSINSKTFFTIFLIKYFPNETFEFDDEDKNKLINLSDKIIYNYFNSNIEDNFIDQITEFKIVLDRWKFNNNIKLQEILKKTYIEIDNSKQEVINNRNINSLNSVEKQFVYHYNKQQLNLKKKINLLKKFN